MCGICDDGPQTSIICLPTSTAMHMAACSVCLPPGARLAQPTNDHETVDLLLHVSCLPAAGLTISSISTSASTPYITLHIIFPHPASNITSFSRCMLPTANVAVGNEGPALPLISVQGFAAKTSWNESAQCPWSITLVIQLQKCIDSQYA